MHRMKSIREKLISSGLTRKQVQERLRAAKAPPATDQDRFSFNATSSANFVAESLEKYVDVS